MCGRYNEVMVVGMIRTFLDLCCAHGPKGPGLVLCWEQYSNFQLETSQPRTKDLIQDWKHEPPFFCSRVFSFPVYFLLILFPHHVSGNMEGKKKCAKHTLTDTCTFGEKATVLEMGGKKGRRKARCFLIK